MVTARPVRRDALSWAARRKELEQDISATHPNNRRRAIATNESIRAMGSRWAEFSKAMFENEPTKTIRNASITDFKLFWEWHLECSEVRALSTLETQWKYLRLHYTCEVGHSMAKDMSTEITAVSFRLLSVFRTD